MEKGNKPKVSKYFPKTRFIMVDHLTEEQACTCLLADEFINNDEEGKGEWKEIDFAKDSLEKPCKEWMEAEGKKCDHTKRIGKGRFEKIKVVKFFMKPSREKMSQSMCLSGHPFGTIKRAMGATYFLLEGLRKVTGKFALFCLGV